MSKILLFDMDGVVVKKTKVFRVRISEKLNIPLEKVLEFFKNEFQESLVGKADLKVVLEKYIHEWGWNDTVESLLKFWFEGESEVDDQLLAKISNYRKGGGKGYLASNNEKYRIDYLW